MPGIARNKAKNKCSKIIMKIGLPPNVNSLFPDIVGLRCNFMPGTVSGIFFLQ